MPISSSTAPAVGASPVTPSNTVPLGQTARSLYVGGAGDVAVRLAADAAAVTFRNVAAGSILPLQAAYVMATGTTATDIIALY